MKKIIYYLPILLVCILLSVCTTTFRQIPIPGNLAEWPYDLPPAELTENDEREAMIRKTIAFLEENNRTYWGFLTEKERSDYLKLYEEISTELEQRCVSFINLDLDWPALKQDVRRKITSADCHGDALGALTRLTYYLKEGHTMMIPERMIRNNLKPGAPYIALSHFNVNPLGASITPCEDGKLIISKVYDTASPYSWSPGDEIAALNGIPWDEWRKPLEQSTLPITGSAGGNSQAVEMNWQKSVMRNIHLFTTVTLRRRGSNKVERIQIPKEDFAVYEQYQEAPFPKQFVPGTEVGEAYDPLEGGVLQGTDIGYINIRYFDQEITEIESWNPAGTRFYKEFRDAVSSFLATGGIILDLRNHGGGMHQVSYGGLELLVKNPEEMQFYDVYEKGVFRKTESSTGTPEYRPYPLLEHRFTAEHPDTYFDRKIILITGSQCISGGDIFTAIASEFEEITVIGTANNGSFAGHMNDRIFKEGEIQIFTIIPSLIWYRHNTASSDLRKSFVEYPVEYCADDISEGKDTLLNKAIGLVNE